jgi:hypothetical protein
LSLHNSGTSCSFALKNAFRDGDMAAGVIAVGEEQFLAVWDEA